MPAAAAAAPPRAEPDTTEILRRLVEEHSTKVFRLAYRMTGNEQDAEDVVQETFLRAHKRIGDFEPGAELSAWLSRIAANHAIDLLRRRKRWRMRQVDDAEHGVTLPSTEPGPERALFGTEVRRRIDEQLARMSPRERVAFTLRHYEGLGIEEIGRVLGTGDSATKNHIFRAVRKLRRGLRPLTEGRRR